MTKTRPSDCLDATTEMILAAHVDQKSLPLVEAGQAFRQRSNLGVMCYDGLLRRAQGRALMHPPRTSEHRASQTSRLTSNVRVCGGTVRVVVADDVGDSPSSEHPRTRATTSCSAWQPLRTRMKRSCGLIS